VLHQVGGLFEESSIEFISYCTYTPLRVTAHSTEISSVGKFT
jgi:hypothetical protein